jgi:hypothetical protein
MHGSAALVTFGDGGDLWQRRPTVRLLGQERVSRLQVEQAQLGG